jgi:hypothetical protein
MRSLIIGIATLALAAVAASPAISASYETGYLGQAMAATGLIKREAPPTCRATASEFEDGVAIVMGSNDRFKEATRIGDDSNNFTCIN